MQAMRHLVILAHPRDGSFTRQVCAVYCTAAAARGHAIDLHDLYGMRFNPVATAEDISAFTKGTLAPDVAPEIEALKAADVITFIAPVWWISMPAILKGWIDRVFAIGFAYGYGPGGLVEGRLRGKKSLVFTSSGSTEREFLDTGKMASIRTMWGIGTVEFCGIELLEHVHFAPVGRRSSPEMVQGYLRRVAEAVAKHF
jgi:NAD(P)H dehydrogenase (quinone)